MFPKVYKFRGFPVDQFAVYGTRRSSGQVSVGVQEWCTSILDAEAMRTKMSQYAEFNALEVKKA